MLCRTLDAPAPTGGRNDAIARTHSLQRTSRLGPKPGPRVLPATGGMSALTTAPTASRKGHHELSFVTELIAAAASAGPASRGERAAGRYAYSFSPRRPVSKLAPQGRGLLWGTHATLTQQNATPRNATLAR